MQNNFDLINGLPGYDSWLDSQNPYLKDEEDFEAARERKEIEADMAYDAWRDEQ